MFRRAAMAADVRRGVTNAGGGGPASRQPRRVLLTNDDGPASPFLARFAEGMRRKLGWPTYVCIPDSNWSYVSKSLKPPESNFCVDLSHSRSAEEQEARVPVSPASCVNLGLYDLAQDADFVVSGPNVGHNLGRSSILSSGTVGAALEACIHGRKAVAVSFPFKVSLQVLTGALAPCSHKPTNLAQPTTFRLTFPLGFPFVTSVYLAPGLQLLDGRGRRVRCRRRLGRYKVPLGKLAGGGCPWLHLLQRERATVGHSRGPAKGRRRHAVARD